MQNLTDALKVNTSITEFSLINESQITAQSAAYFADMLKTKKTLTALTFFSCPIGDEGVKYIADSLEFNRELTSLMLTSIKMSDIGAKYLSNALKKNTTLTSLNLTANSITHIGIKSLKEGVRQNLTLKTLKIYPYLKEGPEMSEETRYFLTAFNQSIHF